MGANVVWSGTALSFSPGERVTVDGLEYSANFATYEYDDEGCYADGPRGGVAFYRPQR